MFSDAFPFLFLFYCDCKLNVVFTLKIILKTFTFMVLRSQEEKKGVFVDPWKS